MQQKKWMRVPGGIDIDYHGGWMHIALTDLAMINVIPKLHEKLITGSNLLKLQSIEIIKGLIVKCPSTKPERRIG